MNQKSNKMFNPPQINPVRIGGVSIFMHKGTPTPSANKKQAM